MSEIHKPKHYELLPGVEAIDVIKAALTEEEWIGYCKGNMIKYALRANKKHDDQLIDIGKSGKYAEFATEGTPRDKLFAEGGKPEAMLRSLIGKPNSKTPSITGKCKIEAVDLDKFESFLIPENNAKEPKTDGTEPEEF